MSDPSGVEDYIEFRQALENAAAGLAAQRANSVDHENLSQAFERKAEAHAATNPDREAEADALFHLAIYEASHNVTILHVMRAFSTILCSYVLRCVGGSIPVKVTERR